MNFSIVVFLIFIAIGIFLIFYSIRKQQKCTEVVTGTVVDISREEHFDSSSNSRGSNSSISIDGHSINFGNSNRNIRLYPIYEYTVGENTYVKRSSSSSSSAFIGQKVEIHYNPENPNDFYVGNNIIGIIVGVIFVVVGLFIAFTSFNK